MIENKEIFNSGDVIQYSELVIKIFRLQKPHRIGIFIKYQRGNEDVCRIKWDKTNSIKGIHHSYIKKISIK